MKPNKYGQCPNLRTHTKGNLWIVMGSFYLHSINFFVLFWFCVFMQVCKAKSAEAGLLNI
jgi:hypothetical protein